ncbi:hypothetical protein SUGI_1169230 [Cryptomeria japonica]|nr:hypothetical protein SUGI_1169230 [Cryptomeria japonica]
MSTASLSSTEAVAGSPCPPTMEKEYEELAFAVLRLKTKSKGSKLRASFLNSKKAMELPHLREIAFGKLGLPLQQPTGKLVPLLLTV